MTVRILILAALPALSAQAAPRVPVELAELVLLSLAPVDGKAVIQQPSGELQSLEVGDSLPGTAVVIRQVLPDRLVLEETLQPDAEGEPAERRQIWLFKAESPGHSSRIQVLDRTRPREPELRQPQTESTTARPPPDEAEEQDDGSDGGED